MMQTPRFKSHLRVKLVPPDLVFFLGETGYKVLQGPIVYLLASYIDGKKSAAEIARKLKRDLSEFDVECGLMLLQSEGVILDASVAPPSSLDALRDSFNIDPELFKRRLKTKRVRVLSFGEVPTAAFIAALHKLGIQTTNTDAFTIALVDDYLRPDLQNLNRTSVRDKRPWMIVKPTGAVLWIGPVFHPPRTACWGCLVRRVKLNREAEAFLQSYGSESDLANPTPALPLMSDAGLNLAAIETLKWLTSAIPQPNGDLLTLDLRKTQLEKHTVTPSQNCPDCGTRNQPAKRALQPRMHLKSCKKLFTHDGGHRSASAETTFQKYKHHISPITGIVDQVEPSYSDANGLVHSYVAGHLFVPLSSREHLLHRGLKQMSAGKGMTAQQARTGALCEALERYSGVFRGDEFRISATCRELGDDAIHPNQCMNYSETQYRQRNPSDPVPAPFDERRKIDWTPVWSLTHKVYKYVPTAYCYYGFPASADHDFCRADSNGNAAGNSLEEAILQGFLELVERDCAALWWYNRIPRPHVDLRSFGLPYFEALRDYYKSVGLEVWVLDISADFPIAAFAALCHSKKSSKQFLLGLGAHFDATAALSRALTEMNQFLRVFLSGGSKHILKPTSHHLEFLKAAPDQAPRKFEDFPRCETNDLRDDVRNCVSLAKARGLETLILDQTRSDVGLPVAKVIVPGLRALWPRFGKGRLYEVPVQLGWLKKALREDQLNPDRIVI